MQRRTTFVTVLFLFLIIALAGIAAMAAWLSKPARRANRSRPTAVNIVARPNPSLVLPTNPLPATNTTINANSVSNSPLPAPVPPAPVRATNAPAPQPLPSPAASTNRDVYPRPVQNPFEAQLTLVLQGISSGSIDGVVGSQTRAAISAFQQREHLPVTGRLDDTTKSLLILPRPALTNYIITTNDLARLQPLATNWLGKSQQSALEFETALELVAEKSFSHPDFIRRLNPTVDWTNTLAGTIIQVPSASYPDIRAKAAYIEIRLSAKTLEAFDASSNLLVHFPCSIAQLVEKRPAGELHVETVAKNPNYTFNPEVFPESPEARQLNTKLILQPGPNNPVGVAWIGLDRPGYGIHGTPKPEDVGRTESHGCFRLANWNAEYLSRLVSIGTPVNVLE